MKYILRVHAKKVILVPLIKKIMKIINKNETYNQKNGINENRKIEKNGKKRIKKRMKENRR